MIGDGLAVTGHDGQGVMVAIAADAIAEKPVAAKRTATFMLASNNQTQEMSVGNLKNEWTLLL